MSKKLADAEARRKIVQELDTTFFVEAGAGSGKTKSLVDRMIALLRAGKCGIGEIAAVTFTRKAAAELRGRFQVELERAVADRATAAPERERLAAALQSLEQCYIGTIHSFCAKMLRERPIESGLDPEFAELEELENDVFRDDCWSEYIVKVRLEESGLLRSLDEAGLSPEDLKGAFDAVSLYPEVKLVGGRPDSPEYEKCKAELESFLERARLAVPKERPEKGYDGLQQRMRQCFRRQVNLGFGDHRALMETFEILDKDPKVTLNRWPSREAAEGFREAYDHFREKVVGPALKAWREYRQERIVRFLQPAIRFFEARRKEENKLNYEDLLLHAARLLRENPEVRRYFSRKFVRVLVDEFQDTDPIQAEVLLYLKGEDTEERDWQRLRPEAGSLFLVGDPKQSIYRFRRADIDIYNLFLKIVEEGGGEVLRLTTNFRSLDVLAEWNNPLWRAALPAKADRYQAAFAPLETVRPEVEGCCSGVRKIVAPRVPRHKGEEIAGFDAAVIGDWIRWACAGNINIANPANSGDTNLNYRPELTAGRSSGGGGIKVSVPGILPGIFRPVQPADFLILTRYKKHLDIYARALEARGIPFEITGSAAFAESEEIGEITNLALALNDPENPVLALAVLRGIFFGVSDEHLEFKREGGRFNFARPGKDILKSKKLGAVYVSMALARLREWRKWTLELPVSAALQRIFEDSGILNFYASLEMGSSRVGNVFKLLEMVRNQERKGVTAFAQVVRFMEELGELREIEEMSLTPARANAVRLMNLHKAKGLEAPIVFLADPCGIKDFEVDKHIVRVGTFPKGTPLSGKREAGGGGFGPLGFFVFKEGKAGAKTGFYQKRVLSQPAGWDGAAAEEDKYEAAEEVRLQYVAATRARNLLVISTYAGEMKNKAWEALDAALGAVPELEVLPFTAEAMSGGHREEAKRPKQSPHALKEDETAALPSGAGNGSTQFRPGLSSVADGRDGVREKAVISKAEVDRARKEIAAGLKSASEPTYAVESVTSLAKKEREAPARRHHTGLGLSWGRLVHQVLEAVGSGRLESTSLELFIDNLLAAEESDFSDKERLLAHVESILASPFWGRVMKSGKRYFEIPFSIRTSRAELSRLGGDNTCLSGSGSVKGAPTPTKGSASGRSGWQTTASQDSSDGGVGGLPVILTGTIDLVFWEDGAGGRGEGGEGRKISKDAGWVIADYKTDRIPVVKAELDSEGGALSIERIRAFSPEFAAVIDFYAPQVRLYTRFWRQITGDPVKESGLYFTSIDRWVRF
jgi:ATP-dependent helicase/nuclease subunit A